MKFPFPNTSATINSSEYEFFSSYEKRTEIPMLPHPGAFGKVRKNHNHEGVDLYCEESQTVVAIEDGEVIGIYDFTGEKVNTPWWNNTSCILIRGALGVFNYGEIAVDASLTVGSKVHEGQTIGRVVPVLKKNKGRPMNMLHLELYDVNAQKHIDEWALGTEKPELLKDPTPLLIKLSNIENK